MRLLAAIFALVACSGPPPESALPPIVVPECDDTSMCLLGFEIEGEFWSVGCSWLSPESVTEVVIAIGDSGIFVDEVRRITGLDPGLMAAAHLSGNDCEDTPAASNGWVAAFGSANTGQSQDSAMTMARAVCDHLETSKADLCTEGGRIQWNQGGVYRFAYFPEYQQEVEAQLVESSGHTWRFDPTEVAMQHWVLEQGLCIDDSSHDFSAESYPRCRIGLNAASIEGGSATVDLTLQWGEAIGTEGELAYSTYQQQATLETTGRAWWVTGFKEDTAISHGVGADGRQLSDQIWDECCTIVLADIEHDIQPGDGP